MTGRDTVDSSIDEHACYSRALGQIGPADANEITGGLAVLQTDIPDVGKVGALELAGRVALLVAQNWREWYGGERASS
jgi:hypothetical protein